MVKKILIFSLFFVFILLISSSYTSASVSESSCKVESSSYIIDEDYYYKSDNGPYALVIGRARYWAIPFWGIADVWIYALKDWDLIAETQTNIYGFFKLWVPVDWFGVEIYLEASPPPEYGEQYPHIRKTMKPGRIYYCVFPFNLINWGS